MNLAILEGEEKLFLKRLEDLYRLSQRDCTEKFTSFLTLRQQRIAESAAHQERWENWRFWGGVRQAERLMLGIFPFYEEPADEAFPLEVFTIYFRRESSLAHRDFLGAFMSLGLKRESIGEIAPTEGMCVVALTRRAGELIQGELQKVGSTGVEIHRGAPDHFVIERQFRELRGTVQSLRLDSVVALVTGLSREKSARLIRSELVKIDDTVTTALPASCGEGSQLSIRGHGKYRLDSVGTPTKKGRLPISYRKYI